MALYKCILLLSFLIPLTLSCLQCDKDLRTMLWQIERAFIPALIKDHNLKTRARILVNGMYHRFFADYASNAYLGFIGVHDYEKVVKKAKKKIKALQKNPPAGKALLDTLVKYRATFARLLKKGLKKYKSKACSPKKCGVLKKKVLDCTRCKKVEPSCFKPHRCKGERIRRVAVEDKGEEKEKKEKDHSWLLIVGLVTVGIAGLLLLAGMVIGAIIYRRSTERLMHKLNPNMAKKRKVSGKVHSSGVG